jgi:hypothetical protein
MKLTLRSFTTIVITAVLLAAPAIANGDAVSDWNSIAVNTVTTADPNRPSQVWFIDMAMVHAAIYDAVQAIDRRYTPYHVEIPGASGSPEAAAAKAAHDVLVHLFPDQTVSLDYTYNQYLSDHQLQDDPGVAVGQAAAAGIIALRMHDGRFPPNQVPFVGGDNPGEWRPTEPSFAPMAIPWLGNVTPFTLKSGDQFRAGPPPALDSHEYTVAYYEVKAMGARFNSARTAADTELALFWAGNYIILWNRAIRDIAAAHVNNIGDSARLFALVDMAMADAVITAWDTKNAYVFWRPITAIRLGDKDTNPDTVGDPDWQPMINTPNYPEYTSGANNISAAATRSLALFFGTNEFTFTLWTTNPAVHEPSRTYSRFSDTAREVVDARIFQGIHFRFGDEVARKQGRRVAQWAFSHFLQPVE